MNISFNPAQQNKQQVGFRGKKAIAENLLKAFDSFHESKKGRLHDYLIGVYTGRASGYIDAALSDRAISEFFKKPDAFLNKKLVISPSNTLSLKEASKSYKTEFSQFANTLTGMVRLYVDSFKESPLYGKQEAIDLLEKFFQKMESRTK